MANNKHQLILGSLWLILSLSACRGDIPMMHTEEEWITPPYTGSSIKGFFC